MTELKYIEEKGQKFVICPNCTHTLMKTPWSYFCFECESRFELDSKLIKME